MGLLVGCFANPVQLLTGDLIARQAAANQPVKFAAMELIPETASGVPMTLGGFYVDGTVDEMKVQHDGNTTRVYCELKLWVRGAPEGRGNQPIGLLSGSAAVDTTRGPRDIALSRQACVSTVAEELVERLLVGDPWE